MNETDLSETFSHLRRWGLKPAQMQAAVAVMATDSASRLLRVTQVQRESLLVHDGRSEFAARQHPALRHALEAQADALACGDWVLAHDDGHGTLWASERLPPLTQLTRRLHDGRDKVTRTVIVSNVDTALLVMGLGRAAAAAQFPQDAAQSAAHRHRPLRRQGLAALAALRSQTADPWDEAHELAIDVQRALGCASLGMELQQGFHRLVHRQRLARGGAGLGGGQPLRQALQHAAGPRQHPRQRMPHTSRRDQGRREGGGLGLDHQKQTRLHLLSPHARHLADKNDTARERMQPGPCHAKAETAGSAVKDLGMDTGGTRHNAADIQEKVRGQGRPGSEQ
jgi:hypothetical protein